MSSDEEKEKQLKAFQRQKEKTENYLKIESTFILQHNFTSLTRDDLQSKTFETFRPSEIEKNRIVLDKIKKWTPDANFGLILSGDFGSGKTHILKALIIKLGSPSCRCLFVNSSGIFDDFRHGIENISEVFARYLIPDILFVDDLGVENCTDFMQQNFIQLIELRAKRNLKILYSTNLSAKEISERYSNRIVERLREFNIFLRLEEETSFRRIIAKKNYEDWKTNF